MVRLLVIFSILFTFTYASGEKYFIKFGSFKNLKGLQKNINRLPLALRSHVIIVKSKGWYIPFAYYGSAKRTLYAKLPKYKHYFPDAHIAHSAYMLKSPIIKNYAISLKTTQVVRKKEPQRVQYRTSVQNYYQPVQYTPPQQVVAPAYQNVAISEEDNTLPYLSSSAPRVENNPTIPTSYVIEEQEEEGVIFKDEPKRYKQFSKKMLSGHHYYLAYKGEDDNPNLLIKVSFGNHEVTYQPIIGDMTMTKANYLIENGRLYMFADAFTRDGAYSKLEKHKDNYFLVSSWANGKKLNILRYYYKLNDAKKYLGIDTSDGLASTLEESEFDQFFIDGQ